MDKKKIALVTGANRGLGLEICRQLAEKDFLVILTSRNVESGIHAVETLDPSTEKIRYCQLDVTKEKSIQSALEFVKKEYNCLDVLINNAGIFLDSSDVKSRESVQRSSSPFKTNREILTRTFETNTLGPFFMCQTFIPLMKKNGYGRIVNVTSQMGQLSSMGSGWTAYRISKTALNAVTKIFAEELKGTNILINSIHPGWIQTDMGGPKAPLTPEEGTKGILWAATLPDEGPSGGFFRDKQEIDW